MIRPFQLGDIFLIQRLGRQGTKLNIIQSLLQPQSTLWASLSAVVPWKDAKVKTYVLRQPGHGLIGDGFLQVQKRSCRPELDIVCLAPGLDAYRGHPAIWEKLLAHHNGEAAPSQVTRLYVDVPDQPLPVNTFHHVGFRVYCRQTIWRLTPPRLAEFHPTHSGQVETAQLRAFSNSDEWALRRLYTRIVPDAVQLAEGMHAEKNLRPPILDWWLPGQCQSFVFVEAGEVTGALQVVLGKRGYWLQIWADLLDPDQHVAQSLLAYGLTLARQRSARLPVYTAVADYQGGLDSLLEDYGFAPFTDRAKMVKHVVQWVREPALMGVPVLEQAARAITAPFAVPHQSSRSSQAPGLQTEERSAVLPAKNHSCQCQ